MSNGYSRLSSVPRREKATIGFILSLIGGILILVQGLLLLLSFVVIWRILENMMSNMKFLSGIITILGFITIVFGLIVVLGAILIYKPGNETIGGILVLVFSIISFFIGGGFIVGTILGVIGGILGLLKK